MQPIQLSIPTPCHENWDAMTPNQQGRFCGSCAKTVVDFSAMTDTQLIRYFENLKSADVCGRVLPDQLNRSLNKNAIHQPRKGWYRLWQYAAALLVLFTKGAPAKAQETRGKVALQGDTIIKRTDIPVMLGGIRRPDVPKDVHVLPTLITQLFITDNNNEPIAGATVQLLPSDKLLVTDSAGRINFGKKHAVKEIKITAVGYEDKQVILKEVKGNSVMLARNTLVLGEVAVASSHCTRRTLRCGTSGYLVIIHEDNNLPVVSAKAANAAFSIFPNPVQKGKEISLSFNAAKIKGCKLLISNTDGKIMLQQNLAGMVKNQPTKISIPGLWSSGTYLLSVANENGHIVQTEKLILL